MDEIQSSMRELLNAANFNQGDLTNTQYRYILSCHDVPTWVGAVRIILGECEPRLVPDQIGATLMACLAQVNEQAEDADAIARILGNPLDQLPRSNYAALAEFCALIRDASSDTQALACLVGPLLLAPRVGVTTAATSASAAVMDLLIEEAETIFGRAASYTKKDAMGVRKHVPTLAERRAQAQQQQAQSQQAQVQQMQQQMAMSPQMMSGMKSPLMPPPGLGGPGGASMTRPEDVKAAREQKRRDQLRAFYQFRSNERVKDFSDCVDLLFENHDFEDIAKGIYTRYGMLPPGWSTDLVQCREEGSLKLGWFKEKEIGLQQGKNAKGRPISLVPAAVKATMGGKDHRSKLDMIIDEIIDTEETYRDNLEELVQSYITQVREIAMGKKGPEAAEELGLTSKDVEAIFGWRIQEIVKLSSQFQKKLEIVALVRTDPRSPLGRQGFVAQAFIDIASELHVYAPYVSAHKTSLQTLEKALASVNARSEKKGGVGALGAALLGGNKGKEALTFVKIWEVVCSNSTRLKGQAIQSLLIMPIQRVPRYKLLLG